MKAKKRTGGYFVISLDLELFWGMFDKTTIAEYGDRILGERTAIPRTLTLFSKYGIHATWATVGMLMARSRAELLALLPPKELRPAYENMHMSSYAYLESGAVGESEDTDKYHFGSSIVELIRQTPHQEIGNHTFSHYYCIDGHENGRDVFRADVHAWNAIAHTYGVRGTSVVFPRNQASDDALSVCGEEGITAYRGNEDHVFYRARKESEQSPVIRALRLLDHYLNLSGYHTYPLPTSGGGRVMNVPSSRFLRPWMSMLRVCEPLRMRRIKNAMTHAAKNGEVFHLWWHPHNMGINQDENFKNLETILAHYKKLHEAYGFESASMRDIVRVASERRA